MRKKVLKVQLVSIGPWGRMGLFVLSLALGLEIGDSAIAQTRPDAGSLMRQLELSLPAPKLPDVGPPSPPPKVEMLVGTGDTLTVENFEFSGNLAVRSAELQKRLSPYLGRPLHFEDLQNAAAEISLFYRSFGLIAAASIPKQTVTDGIVRIDIVEARFSGAEIDPQSTGRADSELIRNHIESALPPGRMVNVYDLDRALLLLNDLPGVSVTGGLRSGSENGETAMVVVSNPKPLISGSLLMDNFGSASTGTTRFVASANSNGAMGLGDLVSVSGNKSEGSDQGQLSLSVPLGSYGTKFTLATSAMNYRIISGQFSSGSFTGTSQSVSADLQHAIIRSRSANLYGQSTLHAKWFNNLSSGSATSTYQVTSLSSAMRGNLHDDFMGGGQTDASIGITVGYVNLSGSANESSDASGPRTAGAYTKFTYALSRTQTMTPDFSLSAKLNGQYALKNLDSSEKLYLGGAEGIRAYPSSEGGGSSGYRAALEADYVFGFGVKGKSFVDTGTVKQYIDNNFSGSATTNDLTYSGFGLGFVYEPTSQLSLQGLWSRRLGTNPYPQSDGSDQDGTLLVDRFWFSGQINF